MARSGRSARTRRMVMLRESDRGTQLVEFGLVSILLFTLLFGVAELGRAVWTYDTVAHAAKEGARYAIVRGAESGRATTADEVETYVRGRVTAPAEMAVSTTWEPDNEPGSVVQVRVDCPFQPVAPFLPPMTLTSTSRMVIAF